MKPRNQFKQFPRFIICPGFTLIELFVVVAIIPILAGMLLPALGKAKANPVDQSHSPAQQQRHRLAAGTGHAEDRLSVSHEN